MPGVRYAYTITVGDTEVMTDESASAKDVATTINQHTGVHVMTLDMVNNYFTRPHKANKRLFKLYEGLGHMTLHRRRLPSKDELVKAEVDKVLATVAD